MFEQLPPHDIAAEEAVLGALLVDDDGSFHVAAKVMPLLNASDFFRESNAWTFAACKTLWDRDEAINQVTVAHEMHQQGHLEDVGLSFLSDLALNLPTPVGAEHYAGIVKRTAFYRRLISASMRIHEVAYTAGPDVESALAKAEALLYSLRVEHQTTDFKHLREYLDGYFAAASAEPGLRVSQVIRTGLTQLDALLRGLKPGQLIFVAARTGFGKTSLMLNFARNAAVAQKARVAVFSLEMAGEELADRLMTAEARVETRKLQEWDLDESEEARVMNAHGVLSSAEIFIDYSPSLRIGDLRLKCQRLGAKLGLDLVVVDYLQLLGSGRSFANRVGELGFLTKELKSLAGDLDVPVIVGAQLSRRTEDRPGHLPLLSDLRESGSIEQDADVVLFIFREEKYTSRQQWEKEHPDRAHEPYPEGVARLIVAKNRAGPENRHVDVRFRDRYTKFEDFDIPAAKPVQGAWI
jgi:replicative DNA helicase